MAWIKHIAQRCVLDHGKIKIEEDESWILSQEPESNELILYFWFIYANFDSYTNHLQNNELLMCIFIVFGKFIWKFILFYGTIPW